MKSKIGGALVAVTLVSTMPQMADAFTSRTGARVNPVNNLVFEVVPRRGSGDEIWCGAADYAQRQLKAPWQARVYVVRGRGQSETTGRRTAVQFTLDPGSLGISPVKSSISINNFEIGESMSVQQAFTYCQRTPPF